MPTWQRWADGFRDKYPYLSVEECKIAIQASTISEYEKKPEHYHTFSANYVIEVFDQYRAWAQKRMNEQIRLEAQDTPSLTPEEAHRNFIIKTLIPAYRDFLEGREDINEIQYPEIYKEIEKAEIFTVDPEIKRKMMKKAQANMTSKMDNSLAALVDVFSAKIENVEISTIKIKRLAMTYACKMAFKAIKKMGYTPESLTEKLC